MIIGVVKERALCFAQKWKMENGKWKMENGKWKRGVVQIRALKLLHVTFK